MKRLLCILLTTLLAVPLAACAANEETGTASSKDVSETGVTESESSTVFTESELIAEIRSYFGGNIPDRTQKAKNLFGGISYTYSVAPVSDYSDPTMTKLTDGALRDVFDKHSWVAFKGTETPQITFDLGNDGHALADIEINMLRQVSYGIELPSAVKIEVSGDGETFTTVSTLQSPTDIEESGKYVYRFAFPETLSAQYIRVTMLRKDSTFMFVDEITAYEYCADGTIDVSAGQTAADAGKEYDYYRYTLQTELTVPVSQTDADYNNRQNLALLDGVTVQALHFDPLEDSQLANNTPAESLSMLTDGVKASVAVYSDKAFAHFYRGYGRHVIVDLGNEMAVDEVRAEFLNSTSVGVAAPPAVAVSISTDGENWVAVYGEATGVYGDKTDSLVQIGGTFKQAYRCRYVRISFQTVPDNGTSCNVYLSEIEIYGKKNAENVPEAQDDAEITYGRYPDADAFGAENILLTAVAGRAGDDNYDGMSVDDALVHLAYYDQDGNMTDSFFDSFLFCPTARFAFGEDSKANADNFSDDLFAEGQNLPALNIAAETVKNTLHTEQPVTVWMNLMCPHADDFCSDVDGDGKAEDFSTAAGRFAYLKYQVDTFIERFTNAGFSNLRLAGFYWNDECLFKNELELNCETVRMINDYIHSLGYKSMWCPYFNAYGIWLWKDIGFDFASLQPNYMFYATESTRLSTAADTALIYGMGVELEIEDAVSEGAVGLYREYLRKGFDSGFMNSVKLYYHGGMPGAITRAATGEAGQNRAIYDETYLLAKRKLDETYNVGSASDLNGFSDTELTLAHGTGQKFSLGDLSAYTVRIMSSPLYGTLRINLNGECLYRAMENFRGDEQILLELSDGAGNRKTVTVTIHITE